jgi:predicted esterase
LFSMQNSINAAEPAVSQLQARYRDGQFFITWKEADTAPGTTYNVYKSHQPINSTTLKQAVKIGHHIERHAARDWWQDPASFKRAVAPKAAGNEAEEAELLAASARKASQVSGGQQAARVGGFLIQEGTAPLDPQDGLFVHTVEGTNGPLYFAVTEVDAKGIENTVVLAGANALQTPVAGAPSAPQPIWLENSPAPAKGSAAGKRLVLVLHGRGGGVTAGEEAAKVNYLAFGDSKQGWREGLPYKFLVTTSADTITIIPSDRFWANRPVMESKDSRDHVPAVNSWWYGYNRRIYETTLTPEKVAPNYSEEKLLWMVRWAQQHLGTDPNLTYLDGSSMGGSGAVSMVMHHPHIFAAAIAWVPIVSYTPGKNGPGSVARLESIVGPIDEKSIDGNGVPLLESMNGTIQATRTKADLPYLFMVHGRTDKSIQWENNPPFYRSMNQARQGLSVYWNNEGHSTVLRESPQDVKDWSKWLNKFALNRSYLVFTDSSDNRDPGNGDAENGDIIGWFNRGLTWTDVIDTPGEYRVTVEADYPGVQLPVKVSVTPRRLQQFSMKAGDIVRVKVGEAAHSEARVDASGLLTIRDVLIDRKAGTSIVITK